MTEQFIFSDICANRHGGNAESEATNPLPESKARQKARVLLEVKRHGLLGLTCDELADYWETTPNAISGRFSELKRDGKISKKGTRRTRSGSSAAVYVSNE